MAEDTKAKLAALEIQYENLSTEHVQLREEFAQLQSERDELRKRFDTFPRYLPISNEQVIDELDKCQMDLAVLAGRVYAEIDDDDATEGRDYRLKAIWAGIKNRVHEIAQLKWQIFYTHNR
ncbi:MAG: hypothetical protein MJA29_11545 [Candidatus Omnitrophica bacterium]|nr:hypothetical protein [Candidatus Omnitrophota bacterium]